MSLLDTNNKVEVYSALKDKSVISEGKLIPHGFEVYSEKIRYTKIDILLYGDYFLYNHGGK